MIRQLLRAVYGKGGKAEYYYNLLNYFPKNLRANLRRKFSGSGPISQIDSFEQRYLSQSGEDGIIRIIFEKIRTTNRFCVEFGIHPDQGNTLLLKKQGWDCLWMDGNGDGDLIRKEYITAENILSLFQKYKVPTEFDLLSIDIDSNDYWIWKAITGYSPRVVVLEYNSSIPPTESKTIAYDPAATWDGTNYFGASLLALVKLGESKGYSLVGCDSIGVNAFFVRKDLTQNHFIIRPIEEAYRPPGFGMKVDGKYIGHPPGKKEMVRV